MVGRDEEYIAIQEKLRPTIGNDIRCRECYKKLASLDDKTNADTLIKYCLQYKREADIADSSLTIVLLNLLRFAHKVNKPFIDVTRDDVLVYLEHMKVGNKWKRTYALSLITVTRFFKWLYSPDIGPKICVRDSSRLAPETSDKSIKCLLPRYIISIISKIKSLGTSKTGIGTRNAIPTTTQPRNCILTTMNLRLCANRGIFFYS